MPALAALVVLGLATVGGGRTAQAQEVGPPPAAPSEPTFDSVEVERLFRETDRLMRQVEPKRVRTIRVRPSGQGDFWTPGELQRLFGR